MMIRAINCILLIFALIFVFQKTELTWGYKETIYPDITDYEDRSLASEMDLQYGYSLAYQNNNLFVGAPRAFQVDAERREGIVYALKYVSPNSTTEEVSEYQLINEINYSDSSFDTTTPFFLNSILFNPPNDVEY